MASALQIKANQENARRSTGPRTPGGKVRSSLNARRHGLLARDAVLPEEDRAAYLELLGALEAEYQPEGPTQTFFVSRLAAAQWRLQRLLRIETGLFAACVDVEQSAQCGDTYDKDTRLLGLLFLRTCNGDSLIKLACCETMLNRQYYRALKALTDARRPTPPARTPALRGQRRKGPALVDPGSRLQICPPAA